MPRWSQLRPLLRFEPVHASPARRRLDRAVTIDDLRDAARHRVPRPVFEFVDGVREAWPGPLVVKGIQTLADARKAADHGADDVVLSAHGGRQLDRCPVPLELLPEVVSALGGRLDVLIDSGVRTGADVAAAVALGAKACLGGRPYLYG